MLKGVFIGLLNASIPAIWKGSVTRPVLHQSRHSGMGRASGCFCIPGGMQDHAVIGYCCKPGRK